MASDPDGPAEFLPESETALIVLLAQTKYLHSQVERLTRGDPALAAKSNRQHRTNACFCAKFDRYRIPEATDYRILYPPRQQLAQEIRAIAWSTATRVVREVTQHDKSGQRRGSI